MACEKWEKHHDKGSALPGWVPLSSAGSAIALAPRSTTVRTHQRVGCQIPGEQILAAAARPAPAPPGSLAAPQINAAPLRVLPSDAGQNQTSTILSTERTPAASLRFLCS